MQEGDVVKLKSGGSLMTIESPVVGSAFVAGSGPHWNCTWWMPKEEKYESRVFPEHALKIVEL